VFVSLSNKQSISAPSALKQMSFVPSYELADFNPSGFWKYTLNVSSFFHADESP
jgi:hypothetical protein